MAFEWSLLTFVRLTTIEFTVINQQLVTIFSSIRCDENFEMHIRKNLNMDFLNTIVETKYDESDWMSVDENPGYYNEKIKLLNEALDECLKHHATIIKYDFF